MSSTASNDFSRAPVHDAIKNKAVPQGKIAQQGMQPSFATELSLDTIEHVSWRDKPTRVNQVRTFWRPAEC